MPEQRKLLSNPLIIVFQDQKYGVTKSACMLCMLENEKQIESKMVRKDTDKYTSHRLTNAQAQLKKLQFMDIQYIHHVILLVLHY